MTDAATREATTYPAAELDRRFYAFAIDRLIAWTIYAGAAYLVYRFLIEPGDLWTGVGAIAGTVLAVGLAFAIVLGTAGTSPGKALVGLRVVRDDDGRPIGLVRALLRTVVLGIAALPTFGLGVATLAWTAAMEPGGRRRGAHDRLSHAAVVDIRPLPDSDDDEPERPRQIVNLTAMRLMPNPQVPPVEAPAPVARVGRPAPPAPERLAERPTPEPAAAPTPAPRPAPAPVSTPVPSRAPSSPTAPPPTAQPTGPPAGPRHAAPVPPASPPAGSFPPPPPFGSSEAMSGPTAHRSAASSGGDTPGTGWRVTFDTGETFVVEGLVLVGRRPEARQGEPVRRLVPLRSTDMSLSKTHAQFQVVPDGALVVMDRGSTNGSVVVRRGVSKALTAGRPATLVDGDAVRFGDRTMTVVREP